MILGLVSRSSKASIWTAVILAMAFALGVYFKYFTKHVDSAAEQAIEAVLEANGIDIDFSEDKKK
jgi:hypothetical protein